MTSGRVCVIGAGVSGLAAIKALADEGIDFDCFEIGSDIGGLWRFDNDNGRSPAYASLHIDTSKERFAFADLPVSGGLPPYLHHSQVLEYLERYAQAFGLEEMISFRHKVISVERTEGGWTVEVESLATGSVRQEAYSAVVVASGHHWEPVIPQIDGPFAGSVMHSQAYRTPQPFIGKDVVVVGVGNSGVDIACDLSWHAKSVTLSTRSGAHVFPRFLFGRPLDKWSTPWSSTLPLGVQRTLYKVLLTLGRGRQRSFGFPTPEGPILSHHPTVNSDILQLVKNGDVAVKPGISRSTEREIVFTDGSSAPADTVIFATGYRISYPFLAPDVIETTENQVELYKRVVAVDSPGLYFVGLIQPVGALPPLAEAQGKWVAKLITGLPLPTAATMKAEIAKYHEELANRYQDRPRHTIQVDYWPYLDDLRRLAADV